MTHSKSFLAQAAGLSLVLLASSARAAQEPKPTPRPPVRVYTNADLDRVHPFASETGVSSVPAVAPEAARASRPPEARRAKGEERWRAEAARVRERLRGLEERAAELRAQIAEQSSPSEVFGRRRASSGKSRLASLQASLAAVERRARLAQEDLEERARRDGALPGWLR